MSFRLKSRAISVAAGVALVLGGTVLMGSDAGAGRKLEARAVVTGPSGVHGVVTFVQKRDAENQPVPGVEVTAKVRGLSEGLHGFHIHENAVCNPGDAFMSAGGHYDPGPASNPSPPDANHPYHLGDLPNLVANKHGRAHLRHETSRITLQRGHRLSIFDPPPENGGGPGSAVIVHQNPDQGATGGPSGGPRIACGVIEPVR